MLMVSAVEGYVARLVAREVLRRAPNKPLTVTLRGPADRPDPALAGADIRYCSYEDPASMVTAFWGVERLLLSPVASSRRDGTAAPLMPAIQAAAEAGVRHIVHRGQPLVTGRESAPVPTTTQIVEAIELAGAASTLIEPGFDPSFLAYEVQSAIDRGELAAPAGDAAVAPLLGTDLAIALAAVLLEPGGHEGRSYTLTGSDTISWSDLAALASQRSGRSIAYRPITEDERVRQLRALGVRDQELPPLLGVYRDVRRGWAATPTGDFERLAGRPATPARDAVVAALDRTAF